MITLESLPADYTPYGKLIVCSNLLINVVTPFSIDGNIPLLVGNGIKPLIWLNMPSKMVTGSWQPLVSANRSLHHEITISTSETKVNIIVKGSPVVKVVSRSDDTAEIEQLDLRPIGLAIYGGTDCLYIGTNQLRNNKFENVKVMVGIGK